MIEFHQSGKGIHRIRGGVALVARIVEHVRRFAEQCAEPGEFARIGPVIRVIVAAEIGAQTVIPPLIIPGVPGGRPVGGRVVFVISSVHAQRRADLPEVVDTINPPGFSPRFADGRQQDRNQDGDDCNYYE